MQHENILSYLFPSLFAAAIIVLPRYIIVWIVYRELDKEIEKKKNK